MAATLFVAQAQTVISGGGGGGGGARGPVGADGSIGPQGPQGSQGPPSSAGPQYDSIGPGLQVITNGESSELTPLLRRDTDNVWSGHQDMSLALSWKPPQTVGPPPANFCTVATLGRIVVKVRPPLAVMYICSEELNAIYKWQSFTATAIP